MAGGEFDALSDEALGERFRLLMRAYDEACMAYDHAKAAEIHREFYATEDELRRRRRDENWRRTGLEAMSLEEVIERFKACAVEYDKADGSDETEHLYWELDDVRKELQRRRGDQRRALFALYKHPDIRVRQAAADATRTLAPLLSQHRQQNIDDDDWSPPVAGLDIAQAGLDAVFSTRAQKPDPLKALSVEQLAQRFVDLALEQDEAVLGFEIARGNRLFWRIEAVTQELKTRPGDQRHALLFLFDHPNPQVRLKAAKATLAIAPAAARQVLEVIAETCYGPQKLDAGMSLSNLDAGIFKPT